MIRSPVTETGTVVPSNNELALERNRLAHERTMMAWIRTSVSLISFGFSIYKFFDYFHGGNAPSTGVIGPRRFAIAMIGIGLFALVAAVGEHWWNARVLRKAGVGRNSMATVVAGLVAIMGVLAMIAVVLRQ
jgi:putative membrane protein